MSHSHHHSKQPFYRCSKSGLLDHIRIDCGVLHHRILTYFFQTSSHMMFKSLQIQISLTGNLYLTGIQCWVIKEKNKKIKERHILYIVQYRTDVNNND